MCVDKMVSCFLQVGGSYFRVDGNSADLAFCHFRTLCESPTRRAIRLRQVRAGLAAELIFEAPLPSDDRFARGFFFAPTVVYGADSNSMAASSKLFGPILVAFEVEDLDHAIQVANQTPYGLSHFVHV